MKITWIQPYYDLILYHVPVNAKKILDVGSGYGIFGYILKKARSGSVVEAIEPFDYEYEHYDHRFKMTWEEFYQSYYDEFVNGKFTKFDCIVSTEMIEHMDKENALLFLEQVKTISNKVIIATPYLFSDQEAYDDNEFQKHRCVITVKEFTQRGYKVSLMCTWMGIASRYFASRLYYNSKISPILKLLGVRPTNIIGVWQK